MWDLPRPGLEPVSPALAGRLSTTAPPGKPLNGNLKSSRLLQILQALLQPHPQKARSESTQSHSKCSLPAVAEMGLTLLGGTAPGDWIPQPSPSRSLGSASLAVLVNNQIWLPAEGSCPSRSHFWSLQVKLFHFIIFF